MKKRELALMLLRYVSLIFFGLGNLYLFYMIFTPLTIYPAAFVLSFLGGDLLPDSETILLNRHYIIIAGACIAGAAYYFLLMLNLTTPMGYKRRIKSIFFIFSSFLIVNIIRIVLLSILISNSSDYFNAVHKFSWYAGSTIILVIIWFINVRLFKIHSIPVYSDMKKIYSNIRKKRRK